MVEIIRLKRYTRVVTEIVSCKLMVREAIRFSEYSQRPVRQDTVVYISAD